MRMNEFVAFAKAMCESEFIIKKIEINEKNVLTFSDKKCKGFLQDMIINFSDPNADFGLLIKVCKCFIEMCGSRERAMFFLTESC